MFFKYVKQMLVVFPFFFLLCLFQVIHICFYIFTGPYNKKEVVALQVFLQAAYFTFHYLRYGENLFFSQRKTFKKLSNFPQSLALDNVRELSLRVTTILPHWSHAN